MLLEWGAFVLWQHFTNHPPLQLSAHLLASSKAYRQIQTHWLVIVLPPAFSRLVCIVVNFTISFAYVSSPQQAELNCKELKLR